MVFEAINEREGALGQLIQNSNDVFEATASRDRELAETFAIFPTFLDESKATLARLERFANNTRPLVNDLKGPADDLGPDGARPGRPGRPDLTAPVPRPAAADPRLADAAFRRSAACSRGASPVFDEIRPFLSQLNPILSYANFHQDTISSFLTIGGVNFGCTQARPAGNCDPDDGSLRYQVNFSLLEPRSFERYTQDALLRARQLLHGAQRAAARRQPRRDRELQLPRRRAAQPGRHPEPAAHRQPPTEPPCFQQPGSLYDGKQFVVPQAGPGAEGGQARADQRHPPAQDPNPSDPLR